MPVCHMKIQKKTSFEENRFDATHFNTSQSIEPTVQSRNVMVSGHLGEIRNSWEVIPGEFFSIKIYSEACSEVNIVFAHTRKKELIFLIPFLVIGYVI